MVYVVAFCTQDNMIIKHVWSYWKSHQYVVHVVMRFQMQKIKCGTCSTLKSLGWIVKMWWMRVKSGNGVL